MKNYYDILEVSKKAPKDIIQKVFKIQIKKYHPDLAKEEDKNISEEKVKELNEAYEVLSDDSKRKIYDQNLEEEIKPNTLLIDKLNEENIILRNKINEQNEIINNYIIPDRSTSIIPENNFTQSDNENFKGQTQGSYIKEMLFKMIFTLVLIFIGMIAISIITGVNLFDDFFRNLF